MAEQRVLFLGDSLTASKYWKAISLPEAVLAGKGFPGQPIGSVMKQSAALLQAFKPTDVVLLAGVNNLVLSKPKSVIMQDLLVAWKQIHDAGAKVYAAKITPWFAYRMFDDEKFANYATDATRSINDWIASMRGQEGGPDYVIDTRALGDGRGMLLNKYSHDKLHLNGKGYKKLAGIVQNALMGLTTAQVGEDQPEMPVGVKYVIDQYSAMLKRHDIPAAKVTWQDKNHVTFWFWTPFRTQTAKEALPNGTKYGAEMIYIAYQTIEEPKVEAGGAPVDLLQEAIQGYVDQLTAKDIPPARVEYQNGTITFWFYTKFRADTAAEVLPASYKIAGKLTNLRMAVLTDTAVRFGAEAAMPNWLKLKRDEMSAMLSQRGFAPLRVTYSPQYKTKFLTFYFSNEALSQQAAQLLPASAKEAPDALLSVYVKTATLDGTARIGQVPATSQETPYTCGPAALRAVLRHYGKEVTEDEAATAVSNVPVLGARPHTMVKGAQQLGFHAIATYLKDVGSLRPFVTHDVPVIVIVDSFLKPGQQGHYVVVTGLDDRMVTIMDPHKEGNWRKLSLQEFDARWWNKRPDANDELEVVRRLALVVVPEAVEEEAGAGGEQKDIAPVHGRIARCDARGGFHKWTKKNIEGGNHALERIFGGTSAKAYANAMDAMYRSVQGMDTQHYLSWFNDAPNADVYLWAIGYLKQVCDMTFAGDPNGQGRKAQALMHALGIEKDAYAGERDGVSDALLKLFLWQSRMSVGLSPCVVEHALQAILVLDYGPLAETWQILEGALNVKPKADFVKTLPAWAKATLDALDEYRVEHETTVAAVGGEYPAGTEGAVIALIERLSRNGLIPLKVNAAKLEEPGGFVDAVLFDFATQDHADRAADLLPTAIEGEQARKVRVKARLVDLHAAVGGKKKRRTPTIRQRAFLDQSRESENVKEVLKAYFLARDLGQDDLADELGARHKTLVEQLEKTVEAGKRAKVETMDVNVDWIFQVEALKQIWPLIEGNRADMASLKKALKLGKALEENDAFMFQADDEMKAFVTSVLNELRTRSVSAA